MKYDINSNLILENNNGSIKKYEYDNLNRLVLVTNSNTTKTKYYYNGDYHKQYKMVYEGLDEIIVDEYEYDEFGYDVLKSEVVYY